MNAEDWQYLYDERAAISEHVYGLPRDRAESVAWQAIKDMGCTPFFLRMIRRTAP